MSVYETGAVRKWLESNDTSPIAPFRTVQLNTKAARRIGIGWDVTWDSPSSIMFTGQDEKDDAQIFHFDVASGKLQKLTSEKDLLLLAYTSFRDGAALYRRQWTGRKSTTPPSVEPALRTSTGEIIRDALGTTLEWAAVSRSGKPWTLPVGPRVGEAKSWISPGGKYAVLALNSEEPGKGYLPGRYMIVDFERQKLTPIGPVAVPMGPLAAANNPAQSTTAFWTSDGTEAVIVNTLLPPKDIPKGNDPKAAYLAAYEPKSGRWRAIQELEKPKDGEEKIRSIGWLVEGKELLVAREKDGKPTGGTVYTRQGDKWLGRPVDASVQQTEQKVADQLGGLNIFVKQSMNEPQALTASDGTREKTMTPPDPALRNVGIAKMKPFTFTMPDGSKLTAGLTLPLDFKPGSRVPLVIQNSAYKPDMFLPDGQVPTGLARQALVAQGFAVLDIGGLGDIKTGPMTEGANFVARIDAAVDALAKEGIVDPARVGLVGHSRMGWRTHYAATHPGKVKLVAAGVWDSVSMNYIEYLEFATRGIEVSSFLTTNGGLFWQNKENWMKHDVSFNADRVEAAMLFVNDIPDDSIADAIKDDVYFTAAALQANRKPFDLIFLNGTGHVVPGAAQRKRAMDLNVDWMNFWIQGKEDPDPAKAEQYKRWRGIRERNEQRKAEEAKTAKTR